MRGRLIIATVVALAAPLGVAGYVQATAENGISTRFKIERTRLRAGTGHVKLHGRLQAPKHKCKAERRVDLYFNRADMSHQADTGWSSQRETITLKGRWRAIPRRVVVIVRRKHVTNPFHRYTCLRKRWVWQIHRHSAPHADRGT
jgi:hypothetical protein